MKILHSINTWFNPTENWILDQINSSSITQDVICSELKLAEIPDLKGQVFVRENHFIDKFKLKLNYNLNLNMKLNDGFRDYNQYDILFTHFGNRAWEDLLYTDDCSLKRIVRFYGIDLDFTFRKKYWPERYGLVFTKYDSIIAEGHAMKKKLNSFGCPLEKIEVIHHGIVPENKEPQKQFSDNLKTLKCLICGRFAEKKGFRYAVNALGELKQKHGIKIELTAIGDAARDNDFKEKEDILKYNEFYDLNINFLGMVSLDEMINQMKKNDIFLSPSVTPGNGDIEGGFPTTLIHAANQGMILIGTTHCDIPEIIHHEKNGYLSPERDVNSLVENLHKVTTLSKEQLEQMSSYSYNLVKTDFNLEKEGRELEILYKKLNGD